MCWVDRHVGQTGVLEHAESPLRWVCWRHVVQYLGVMWTFMVLVFLRMMVWLMGVSWLRKALAWSGVEKNTLIALGASKVVEVRC